MAKLPKAELKRRLRELVELFLATYCSDLGIPEDCMELDEDTSRIAADILQLLCSEAEIDSPIDSPEELGWFLHERIEDFDEPQPEELDRSVEELQRPARIFRFEVRLWPWHEGCFPHWMGGPHALDVALDSKEPSDVWLLGQVNAATHPGAVLQVERVLDAFLGASDVIGLSRYLPRRDEPCLDPKFALGEGETLGVGIMGATYAERLYRTFSLLPSDLSDLELAQLRNEERERAVGRHLDLLRRVMAGTSSDAQIVRNACRHAMNAVASVDHGVAITLAFSAMEGLLLSPSSKSDTLAGLREAVAHTFGTSLEDRNRLRKLVNELYEVRSVFVHTGQTKAYYGVRQETLALMRGVIRAQIERLPRIESDPRPPESSSGAGA